MFIDYYSLANGLQNVSALRVDLPQTMLVQVLFYFLRSICLKTPCSRPSCLKVCWLTVKVKAVLSSWVNDLSAPQNGKSVLGNPLWLKNDIYKKVQIFDLKKQAKSLISAPESCYFHRFEYSYAVGHKWQKLGKYNKLNFCIKSWVEKWSKMRKKLNRCNFPTFLPAPQIFLLALFSLHYQNLGGFGGVFKVMERRKYKISALYLLCFQSYKAFSVNH